MLDVCVLCGTPCTLCVPSCSGKCMNRPDRVSGDVRRDDDGGNAGNVGGGTQLGNTRLDTAYEAQLIQDSQDGGGDVWVDRWK